MQRKPIEQPLIDQIQIALLREAIGEQDLRDLLLEFPGTAEQAFQNMGTALASNDLEKVRHLAHSFKGAASSFGAAGVAAIACELELEATSIASMTQLMPTLARAIDETVAALRKVGSALAAGAGA